MERRDRGRNTEGVDWTGLLDVDEFRGGVRKGEGGLAKGPRQTMEGFMGVVWEESRSQDKVILDDEILNRVRGLVNAGNAEQKFMGLYGMCLALRPKLGVSEEIKAWIMSWGRKAEVLEPEYLREDIQAEVEGMLERCGKGIDRDKKPITA